MKPQIQSYLTITLAVLLFLALAYIAVGSYQSYTQQREVQVFQAGAQAGYEQAIIELIQESHDCQVVPIHVQNITVPFVNANCHSQLR